MAETTVWWLITGGAIAVELLTGTFYLLMLGIGFAAGGIAAQLALSVTQQMVSAAVVGGGAVALWHVRQGRHPAEAPAQANANVNLDIGQELQVADWHADGSADVHYRGARWTAVLRPGAQPLPGAHRVVEVQGSRLVLEKV